MSVLMYKKSLRTSVSIQNLMNINWSKTWAEADLRAQCFSSQMKGAHIAYLAGHQPPEKN